MIKGFIFDMDGTMIDNMMVHHRAWQRKLAALGLELSLEEVRQTIHGINEEIIERLFGEQFSPEERRRIAWEKEAEYREIIRPELKLIEGLPAFLQAAIAQNIPMGIGTAAPPENVNFVLDELQLRPLFRTVIDSKMVTKGKPDPEVFLTVADQLGLKPENCLVFEDSPTGAEATWRAGMPAVILSTTHTPEEFARFDNIVRIVPNFSGLQPSDWVSAMQLREARLNDIPQIQLVRNSVRENALSNPAYVTDADCVEFLSVRGKGWVCTVANEIVGFAIADLQDRNIWALFLRPEFESKGFGKKLHDTMLDWYFSQTKDTVWLGTAPATRAEQFYLKAGWTPVGTVNKGEVKFEMTFDAWAKLSQGSKNK